MSLQVDLTEFLTAYLAEADELLTAANARLLAIESSAKAGTSDPKSVRELFRVLHTLKGLTTMVGIEPIVAVAHRMEAILRAADRSGGALSAPTAARLFDGLRAIEQRLAALGRKEAPAPAPAELLAALDATPSGDGEKPAERAGGALDPTIAAKLAPFERERLLHPPSGSRALRIDFAPSPKRAAEGLSIDAVRQRVGSIAEIVRVVPLSVPSSDAAPGGLVFAVLVVTTATDVEIAAAVGVDAHDVKPLSAPEPDAPALARLSDDDEPAERRGALRVDVARIDDALERLSSLVVTRSRLARAVAELSATGAPTRELAVIVQEAGRQIRDLRATILSLRMIPFGDVLSRLPLVLRGLQRATAKDVRLVTEANDAELDKAVAERVFPALVHLMRNAVDHGIEQEAERVRKGKPPQGTVRVGCRMRSNRQLEIVVEDDGAGIDRAAVARAAGRPVPDDDALLEAICRPGFSTRESATATSGRGMGMEIVHKIVVGQLGGELTVDTRSGEGTRFVLRIPLTVAIVDAFTVQCREERFAVPVAIVEEILEVDPARVVQAPPAAGRALSLIVRRGEAVPLVHLFHALGRELDEGGDARAVRALVVRRGDGHVAFRLDRVLAQQETVVRPLADPLVQVPGIAGSTDLGDGRATLVLDLLALAGRLDARRREAEHAA